MSFIGKLGSSDSRLGNVVLGLGSSRGRRFRRSALTPFYRVQVLEMIRENSYGIGEPIAEFDRIHGLAYADYVNSVPEAFFTVHQDDPKIKALRNKGGRAHVRIWRHDDLVWAGWVALERDANGDDSIFYCYGYLSGLFWLHTGWKQEWTNALISDIVRDSWVRAKTTLSNSRLGFVQTGLIQEPPTEFGGSIDLILPKYTAFRKRILFLMQEMAAISSSDTGNSVMFGITHQLSPAFQFRTHRSTDLTTARWEWGGKVQSFREYVMPVYHRNHLYGIGQNPRNAVLQTTSASVGDMEEWGRMEEALFFSWVRDETELNRALKLRREKALQHDHQLTLSFFPGSEVPPGSAESRWNLGDTVPIKIDRGVTYFDGRQQIVGYMVSVLDGQEYVRAVVQEPL